MPPEGGDQEQRGSLRASLGGLTTRGRSFVAAGLAATACAYVLGQADLLRVGMMLVVLPLVCVVVLHRTRYRVVGSRLLSPPRVGAGGEASVHLRVSNVSQSTTGPMMLQDKVPYVLGPRPRFVLDRIEAGGRREVTYRVRSDMRGRFVLGPLQLRLTDPFGMVELTRSFSAQDTLTVLPPTEPLPPVRLTGEAGGYGESRQRPLALAGDDDVIPRAYRHGDDLRRVHWRSTARYGDLMVRREEQPQQPRCTVLLDTRDEGWAGSGPGSPFEWAVSAAASTVMHLIERGYEVQLLTAEGTVAGEEGAALVGDSTETAGLLMDSLAMVECSEEADLGAVLGKLHTDDGLLIAFLGGLDEAGSAELARARRRTGAIAFLSHGQHAGGDDEARARSLREAGWTVTLCSPSDSYPELWQGGGQTGSTDGIAGGGGL